MVVVPPEVTHGPSAGTASLVEVIPLEELNPLEELVDLAKRAGEALAAVAGATIVDAVVMASAAARCYPVIVSSL
jgi:hypothetical protein